MCPPSEYCVLREGDIELTEEQLSGMMSPPPGYSSQEDRPPYATAEQVHHCLLRNQCGTRAM